MKKVNNNKAASGQVQCVEANNIVKSKEEIDKNLQIEFTFADFKLLPINLEKEFNNFFKDEEEYMRKITIIFGYALPLLSKENVGIFTDKAKMKRLHMHKIGNKNDILEKILKEYKFSNATIDNMIEGENIYQLEVPYENGATRIVFQKLDNIISFLFLDPNHHIYFNEKKVSESGSLFYEFCPVYNEDECNRMDYLHTCFAFEFLDIDKYKKTYDNSFSPK